MVHATTLRVKLNTGRASAHKLKDTARGPPLTNALGGGDAILAAPDVAHSEGSNVTSP